MIEATPDTGAAGVGSRSETDERVARRARWAGVALVVVLLAVSVFAIWSAEATTVLASRTAEAVNLSDDYARARTAVSAQESLERKYRLEPGPDVRARFAAAADDLYEAFDDVARDGDDGDRALVERVGAQHREYVATMDRMFDAVDRGDAATAHRVDNEELDPAFTAIEAAVAEASHDKHTRAIVALDRMQSLQVLMGRLTPVVFLAGLLLAALLAAVTRGHRRLLDEERARAVHASLHDGLTGLPNRRMLTERLTSALGPDATAPAALLLIDLDHFKEINDTFGHHYGDGLLRQVGPRLTGVVGDSGTVARLGGDEFAVLLPGVTDADTATVVAQRLVVALEAPFEVEDVGLDVEASVGVVVAGEHGRDPVTLLQRADIAMYVAKNGRLGIARYDAEADGHSPARLALLGDLRRGIERDELVLHYQPKVHIRSGDVVGVEALVRWQHPDHGLLYPDSFIPVAEHSGLIGPLTDVVLDAALRQAARWAADGRPMPVSVNLSARSLLDQHLPDAVAACLARHGVPSSLLQLEVTESAIMSDPDRARQLLQQLADMGVHLSIDDFGAGYTSLSHLKTLPVSELKIDRSFVMTMSQDRSNAVIVDSVVELGHNLGLSLVAEGVEDDEVLRSLAAFGCDVAQGYLLSQPVPARELETWLAQRASTVGDVASASRTSG